MYMFQRFVAILLVWFFTIAITPEAITAAMIAIDWEIFPLRSYVILRNAYSSVIITLI